MGVPYTHAIDMWSFGCIIFEMVKGRPLFTAGDEKELLEMIRCRIGMPPDHMRDKAKRKTTFFNLDGTLKRSEKSRVPADMPERSETI